MNTGDQLGPADDVVRAVNDLMKSNIRRLRPAETTLDVAFLAYVQYAARFGFFSFGPVHIDASLIEDIVERTVVRLPQDAPADFIPPMADDYVRFSARLMEEVRRSGRRRIDELHFLLAFMRMNEGLPKRVFGELGVSPDQVEEYARSRSMQPKLEKLFSPEEAAAYLNVHVQTVRAWIRSGRLHARRLAGQRALRITASDLQSVLEPLDLDDDV